MIDPDKRDGWWAGFDSLRSGCDVASEEALVDLENVTGHPTNGEARLNDEDFDLALIEGEAWGDEWPER